MRKAVIGASVAGMLVIGGAVYRVYLVPADQLPTTEPSPAPTQEPRPTEPPPTSGPPPPSNPPPPSGQVGHGRNVTGGAGGRLIVLGPSSTEADVRAALTATGPREIKTVAGMAPSVWQLTAEALINGAARGDVTIDCSASKGCTIIKKRNAAGVTYEGVRFANMGGKGNIIIRKVRFVGDYVPGKQPTPHVNNSSALEFDGAGNFPSSCIAGVYLDHVVVSNAVDSGPDLYGCVTDVTIADSFIYDSLHPNTIAEPMIKTRAQSEPRERVTMHRNFFAANGERSMALRLGLYDFDGVNNVIWNWAATDYGNTPLLAGGYGSRIEDDVTWGPDRILFRENAWIAGPLSVNGPIDHRGWGLIYGTKGGCDAGGAPTDVTACNVRMRGLTIRTTNNIYPPQQSKYDAWTTAKGASLANPSYPLTVLSSRDLESVILGAGIPEADTPREAQIRADALAAYLAMVQ